MKERKKELLILIFVANLIACSISGQKHIKESAVFNMSKLCIHVINVDQGDCILIISPSGKRILIDAGNNGKGIRYVLPYLKNLNIAFLDYIIATHYHPDHIGGIDEVVNGLGGNAHITYAAYDRGGSYYNYTYADYAVAVGEKRSIMLPGQIIDLEDGAVIKCIASGGSVPGAQVLTGDYENSLSIVFILSYFDFQMYFGGDSDFAIEPFLAPYAGDVDVYKVSHHGSVNCSTQRLLDYMNPEVAIIPVGNGNTYHHPDPVVVSRLVNMNCYIYQTETGVEPPPAGKGEVSNGNIQIVTDGQSYSISGPSLIPKTRLTDSRPMIH